MASKKRKALLIVCMYAWTCGVLCVVLSQLLHSFQFVCNAGHLNATHNTHTHICLPFPLRLSDHSIVCLKSFISVGLPSYRLRPYSLAFSVSSSLHALAHLNATHNTHISVCVCFLCVFLITQLSSNLSLPPHCMSWLQARRLLAPRRQCRCQGR